jgi:hypothetical protein
LAAERALLGAAVRRLPRHPDPRPGLRLSDKRCPEGTLREDLFLHTEAGAGNTQCADAPGDQICRWEYPRVNDYTSHGCIKLSPPAILALTRAYHRYFHAGVRYPLRRVQVLVR